MIHILTGEYPPDRGGVGDYTALVADKLAACGEDVQVWTGGRECESEPMSFPAVRRIARSFGPCGMWQLDRAMNATPPSRILVQWTPHSFGFRSLNILVPLWLWKRARIDRDQVELVVHEPFVAFGGRSWRRNAAALVHRLMMAVLLRASTRVFVTIPAWGTALLPWCLGRPMRFEWLPIPSNLDTFADPRIVRHFRASLERDGRPVLGHFGSFRADVSGLLAPALRVLLETTSAMILLAGSGSLRFHDDFCAAHPAWRNRLLATGDLPPASIAAFLSACDVLLQPYPDGISARRGSAMAALALGIPLVSNLGALSEGFWPVMEPVALAASCAAPDLAATVRALLGDAERRSILGQRARETYLLHFDVAHTVNALRGPHLEIAPRAAKAVA